MKSGFFEPQNITISCIKVATEKRK